MGSQPGGAELTLDTLGLTGEGASSPRQSVAWPPRIALLALMAVLIVVCLIAASLVARTILFPVTRTAGPPELPRGRCFVLDPYWCIELDERYVEQFAGVQLPPGAHVLESGSWRNLKSGIERARVTWPIEAATPALVAAGTELLSASPGSEFSRVDASWRIADGQYTSTAMMGVGIDGRPLLTVERQWNG
ncbi:hypothetical protein [Agromyces bauzanensis]